ncbi:MAG TPA: diacylglycerol kinase family protein [Pyrinomonadaceae bacterium]|nr:diacylglycerol kinase family protein [Pyrinomonadaceae bacterium]
MPQAIEVIINAGSGSVRDEETKNLLIDLFEANGVKANIYLAKSGLEIAELTLRFANGEAEIIVGGGGDGTISTVAAGVAKSNKIFGVLPLGTLNNFSKDLQIPQNIEDAVRIIAEKNIKTIDLGEVNGRCFVNNSSIGLYPRIVRRREKQQRLGRGKWSAAFWAALRILRRSPFFAVRLETANGKRIVKTPFVFVGNNSYEMDFFNIGRRAKLDDGKLSVYFLNRSNRRGLFVLALRTIFGRLRQTKDFEEINTEAITIETRKKRILVAFDGEVKKLETPLNYKIHARALRVIVPE